jgi:hypothetical protein
LATGHLVLGVLKERHKSEIHVKLLVTMKERVPGIVSDEIHLRLLKSAQHHDILDDTGCWFPADVREFEAVAVKM